MNQLFFVLPILSFILIFFLGIIVFLKNPKDSQNRTFFAFSLSLLWWLVVNFIVDYIKDLSIAFRFSQLAAIGPIIAAPLFFYFSLIFPRPEKKLTKVQVFFILFFCVILLILVPTKFNVEKVWSEEWGVNFKPGWLYYFLGLYLASYFILIFKNLFIVYKKADSLEKTQIEYLLLGLFFTLTIGLITNLGLPLIGYNRLVTLGPSLSVLPFVGFVAYAIVSKHLFEIEVILTEILVGAIGTLLLFQIFMAQNTFWKMTNSLMFFLFFIFGWLLTKYTFREIKRREEAEKLSQAKTEFLSIVSHQLRTPLTAIKGYLSMILEGTYGKVPIMAQKPLENIYASNERLIRLVNDFLQVSRLETGKIDIELKKTNLESLIQGIVDELWIKTKEKGLYLKFEKPKEQIPEILVDKEKIRQVVLNLIDNAIRYTSVGGINISLEKRKNYVRIIVKDSGEGLEKEEAERLFKSFSRGAAGQKMWAEGAGLGLYIAKKLVELHKGKIWAVSEGRQKGSTFYVELAIQ